MCKRSESSVCQIKGDGFKMTWGRSAGKDRPLLLDDADDSGEMKLQGKLDYACERTVDTVPKYKKQSVEQIEKSLEQE